MFDADHGAGRCPVCWCSNVIFIFHADHGAGLVSCVLMCKYYVRAWSEDILCGDWQHRVGSHKQSNYQTLKLAVLEARTYESPPTPALLWKTAKCTWLLCCTWEAQLGENYRKISSEGQIAPCWALTRFPYVLITSGLMVYYEWDGNDSKEMENHSDQTLQLITWSTRSRLVNSCNYAYVSDLLTSKFFIKNISLMSPLSTGVNYSSVSSLRHLLWNSKTQGRTIIYIKDYHPKLRYLLDGAHYSRGDREANYYHRQEEGLQVFTITGDYDMEITVKHIKKQWLLQPEVAGTMTGWLRPGGHYSTEWVTTTWAAQLQPLMTRLETTTACGVATTPLQVHYH